MTRKSGGAGVGSCDHSCTLQQRKALALPEACQFAAAGQKARSRVHEIGHLQESKQRLRGLAPNLTAARTGSWAHLPVIL